METTRALQRQRRSQSAAGIALVVIGLVAWALQYLDGSGRAVVLVAAGGSFIAAYLYSEIYLLLVPGGILLGLGLGSLAEWQGIAVRDPNAIGLGVGFLAIYAIARLYHHRTHWWPLAPGVVLVGIGVGARFGDVGLFLWRIAPALLVLIGLALLYRATRLRTGVSSGPS